MTEPLTMRCTVVLNKDTSGFDSETETFTDVADVSENSRGGMEVRHARGMSLYPAGAWCAVHTLWSPQETEGTETTTEEGTE